MSESELIAHKKSMEVAFEKNRTPRAVRGRVRAGVPGRCIPDYHPQVCYSHVCEPLAG